MGKYIFFIFLSITILHNNKLISCPHEFSPDDERPFFEQYEIETNTSTSPTKEDKS